MAANEVCDVWDISQFLPGRSAYECVAYAAALLKYAGKPGQGPIGSTLQTSNLAQWWYGHLEGSIDASNKNGMSLMALHLMLGGMGLEWTMPADSLEGIKHALATGQPCIVCGAETGMVDMALGDRVPYNWTPTGNHAIVVTGVAPDGNLLVHDTANVDAQGRIRPGPRTYDASRLQVVSVTSVQIGEPMKIDLSMPEVASHFSQNGATWLCKQTGKPIGGAILTFYQSYGNAALCGLTFLGLPLSGEKPIQQFAGYEHLAGKGIVLQPFERGIAIYDPGHEYDNPPGAGAVYLAHLYSGAGVDPEVAQLQAQLQAAQAQPAAPQEHALLQQFVEQAKALGIS